MPKDAILQVRMNPTDKLMAEQLYEALGMSFPEAVRIFARQSILVGGLPFSVTLPSENKKKTQAFSELSSLINEYPAKPDDVEKAIEEAISAKYGSIG